MTRRAVVYVVAGGDEERQLAGAAGHCEAHGYAIVAVVREEPGRVTGLVSALRMVDAGDADVVVTATAATPIERAGGAAGRPRLVDERMFTSTRRPQRRPRLIG